MAIMQLLSTTRGSTNLNGRYIVCAHDYVSRAAVPVNSSQDAEFSHDNDAVISSQTQFPSGMPHTSDTRWLITPALIGQQPNLNWLPSIMKAAPGKLRKVR